MVFVVCRDFTILLCRRVQRRGDFCTGVLTGLPGEAGGSQVAPTWMEWQSVIMLSCFLVVIQLKSHTSGPGGILNSLDSIKLNVMTFLQSQYLCSFYIPLSKLDLLFLSTCWYFKSHPNWFIHCFGILPKTLGDQVTFSCRDEHFVIIESDSWYIHHYRMVPNIVIDLLGNDPWYNRRIGNDPDIQSPIWQRPVFCWVPPQSQSLDKFGLQWFI